ncbi:unnamed protein product [Candidula unifasciata]|uniref:Uncharacterized protein n=1 Tax=Candidula unifasciata TaxID=100452 RepID=A0A8S3ZAG8_9EUPU|nr:unnamed protein product [Candidula unifasciata]
MELWKIAMLSKFGKKAKKKWSSAAVDFQMVDLGIKPVCLFDHWSVTAEDMQDFTLDLHKHGLTRSKVNVISIGQDVVVYSISHGKLLLAASLDSRCYIDISASLLSPDLANNEGLAYTVDVFSNLCRNIHSICERQDSESVHDVGITDILNGCCLFGLLLGYPCVYWFDLSEGDDHCLSTQSLRLFKVIGHKLTPAIDKKPDYTEQVQGPGNLNSSSVAPQKTTVQSRPSDKTHVIFSFTVPVNILAQVEGHIRCWFVLWRDSVQWFPFFSEVWLEEETVSPQSVCL